MNIGNFINYYAKSFMKNKNINKYLKNKCIYIIYKRMPKKMENIFYKNNIFIREFIYNKTSGCIIIFV